jgi:hypothetical protein
MSKPTLRILAVLLSVAIVIVLFSGLDSLPAETRKQIAAERAAYTDTENRITVARDEVNNYLKKDPGLFRSIPSSRSYPDTLARAGSVLASAHSDVDSLAALEKRNRRSDREQAAALLAHARKLRESALKDADGVRKEAEHWVYLQKHLPEEVQDMERDYKAVQAVDLNALASTVQKAGADWPQKKSDLEARLASVRDTGARAQQAWQSSAAARSAAAANNPAQTDFGALFGAADTLHSAAAVLPQQAAALQSLSGQLYVSWDKLLIDMDQRDGKFRQEIRTVSTKVPDASAKNGTTTNQDAWVDVSRAQYQAMERNLGMAVEHKPAGRYDIESERTAQPPGFAYMAPPGQSNQYGYWEHSGGRDFWVFYGQYALMRDLFFGRDYRPLDRWEYENYRTYRDRNQTYYGGGVGTNSAPKYGTGGSTTQERYSGSTFAKSGGFRDSKYASKPGGYRDSQYSSPSVRNPDADHSPRSFGSGSRPAEQPHSYRPPPPRPSAPRSAPRSFGRRR